LHMSCNHENSITPYNVIILDVFWEGVFLFIFSKKILHMSLIIIFFSRENIL